MLISCLTITQPGRFEFFSRSVDYYERQTWDDRELVVIIDGPETYRQKTEDYLVQRNVRAHVLLGKGDTMGKLRNESVAAATGQIVCQWDDDDQYHSRRLEVQAEALLRTKSDICCLSGFLHYFSDTDELSWVDWRRTSTGEFHPDLPHHRSVGPSIMAMKNRMPPYPPTAHGDEDALVLTFAVLRKLKFHVMEGFGWCYCYMYHGTNMTNRISQVQMNRVRSKPLNAAEIDHVVTTMKNDFDTNFTLATVLNEYAVNGATFATALPECH